MNIAVGDYTRAELFKALCSSNRKVWYEYTIANTSDETIGSVSILNGQISFDSTREVMRQLSGEIKASDLVNINMVDERIIPWMCMEYNNDVVRWALGRFMIQPSLNCENNAQMIQFTGYDRGKVAYDDLADTRIYIASGTVYTSAAAQIAGTLYSNMSIKPTTKTTSVDKEWELGTRKIEIINELLAEISYNPLHFDEYGQGIFSEYVDPYTRSVEAVYRADQDSVILDGINIESDAFDVPNKFVRYTESADSTYMISTYEITDADNPYSTTARGRTITSCESVKDIATQSDLDTLTAKAAYDAMQRTERITFTTVNMPGHGYMNAIFLDVPLYNIYGKYIEKSWSMDLSTSGNMQHICEKVVRL